MIYWTIGIIAVIVGTIFLIGATLCRHAENVSHKWELGTTIEEENSQLIKDIVNQEIEKEKGE